MKVDGNNILGRWNHTFSSDSSMTLQLYWDRTHLVDPMARVPWGRLGP